MRRCEDVNLRLKIWLYLSILRSLAQPWILHDYDKCVSVNVSLLFWVVTFDLLYKLAPVQYWYSYSRQPEHLILIIVLRLLCLWQTAR